MYHSIIPVSDSIGDRQTASSDSSGHEGGEKNQVNSRTLAVSRSPSPEHHQTAQRLCSRDATNSEMASTKFPSVVKSRSQRRHAHLLRNWWLEFGACLVFILALLAIVVTLYPHHGKPLPQWPYSISINSLISIYVVILKATVLLVTAEGIGQLKWQWFRTERPLEDINKYDSASRGALGSLSLLWTLGLRHPLASCGALITILMLAIDPFAQQIIRYRSCITAIYHQQGKIPRTNFYKSHGQGSGSGFTTIEPQLQSAYQAGVFSPGILVSPDCSTGNCTFPQQYNTVGYCARCSDITTNLNFTHYPDSEEATEWPGASILSSLPSGTSINSTEFTIPADHYHDSGYRYHLATMTSTPDKVFEIIIAKTPAAGKSSQSNATCQNGNSSWPCLGYGAAKCSIDPCVRAYTASIVTGKFEETLVSETDSSIWHSDLDYLAAVDTQCISSAEHDSLVAAGYDINPQQRWLAYNRTLEPTIPSNDTFPSSMLQKNCLYLMDMATANSLWVGYLDTFLNGTLIGKGTANVEKIDGPQALQNIYDYGNVTFDRVESVFRNISDSMTTYIRQAGVKEHSIPTTGTVMHDDTCLQVRWAWLVLPGAVVIGTLLFFAVMVIQTRPTGDRAQIWKSSPLALMFHGLTEPDQVQRNVALEDIRDMDRTAKGITVRLAPSDGGVNLVAVADSSNSAKTKVNG